MTSAANSGLPTADDRPVLMGVVNVTPDSFSDGGSWFEPAAAIAHGRTLAGDGADLVDVFARRPQVQERLTTQIADALVTHLQVQGVIVVVECEHLCMSMRGVRKPGSRTITSAVRGQLRDPATRAEAMSLLLGGGR